MNFVRPPVPPELAMPVQHHLSNQPAMGYNPGMGVFYPGQPVTGGPVPYKQDCINPQLSNAGYQTSAMYRPQYPAVNPPMSTFSYLPHQAYNTPTIQPAAGVYQQNPSIARSPYYYQTQRSPTVPGSGMYPANTTTTSSGHLYGSPSSSTVSRTGAFTGNPLYASGDSPYWSVNPPSTSNTCMARNNAASPPIASHSAASHITSPVANPVVNPVHGSGIPSASPSWAAIPPFSACHSPSTSSSSSSKTLASLISKNLKQQLVSPYRPKSPIPDSSNSDILAASPSHLTYPVPVTPLKDGKVMQTTPVSGVTAVTSPAFVPYINPVCSAGIKLPASNGQKGLTLKDTFESKASQHGITVSKTENKVTDTHYKGNFPKVSAESRVTDDALNKFKAELFEAKALSCGIQVVDPNEIKIDKPFKGVNKNQDDLSDDTPVLSLQDSLGSISDSKDNDEELGIRGNNLMRLLARTRSLSESSLGSYLSDIDCDSPRNENDQKLSALEEMIEKLVSKAISEAVSEVLFENQCKTDEMNNERETCQEVNNGTEACKEENQREDDVASVEAVTEESVKENKDQENIITKDESKEKEESVSDKMSSNTEKDLTDQANIIDLNPRSPEFKPRKAKGWSKGLDLESNLNPSVPEFTPLSFSLSQHSDMSGSDPGYLYSEDFSSFSDRGVHKALGSHCDLYVSHDPRTYSKNRSIQTDSMVLIDTGSNTRQVKFKDQGVETKSCDSREVCINTMESYEIEENDRVINLSEKRDQETMTVKKKTKSKITMVTDEDPDLETVPSPRKAYEISLREKLLKTQRDLLRLRGRICLDEIQKQIHQLQKNKEKWGYQFSPLYQFRPLESVIDAQINKLKVDIQILKGKLKSCEDQLDAGEMLIPDVPCFAISLPVGPTEVHVVNKERVSKVHSNVQDQISQPSPVVSTSLKNSVINSGDTLVHEMETANVVAISDVDIKQETDPLERKGKNVLLLDEDANISMGFEPSVDKVDMTEDMSAYSSKGRPSPLHNMFDQLENLKETTCLDETKSTQPSSFQDVPEINHASIPKQPTNLPSSSHKIDVNSDELQLHSMSVIAGGVTAPTVSADFDHIPHKHTTDTHTCIKSSRGETAFPETKREILSNSDTNFADNSQMATANSSTSCANLTSTFEVDLNVPSIEQELEIIDQEVQKESTRMSGLGDNLMESKEGAVNILLSEDKTLSMSEQNQLCESATAFPALQSTQASVDPKLFESVLNELIKAYPHLTANPLMLQSVAMQQTMVLQEFIARNSVHTLSNQGDSNTDLTLQPNTCSSDLSLGSAVENPLSESESGASKVPPGFTEKVDEIPGQDVNTDINSETAMLETLMTKSPDKKKKLISIPLPCNPLGMPSANTSSPSKDKRTEDQLVHKAAASKKKYNLSISDYVHVIAGVQDNSPEKDRTCLKETMTEGTCENLTHTENTNKLFKEVDLNVNNIETQKSEVELPSLNQQNMSQSLNEAPTCISDDHVKENKDHPDAQNPKLQDNCALKQNTTDYSSLASKNVINQLSSSLCNVENVAPESGKVFSTVIGDKMCGKVQHSSKTSSSKTMDSGKDQGDWWGTESDDKEPYGDHVSKTMSHDYGDHVTKTMSNDYDDHIEDNKSRSLSNLSSQGVSDSKVKNWLDGVPTCVEEPAPKMLNAWMSRDKVKAIDPFTPKWMKSSEAKPPLKSQLDPFAPKWMETEAACGTSMTSSEISLRMRMEYGGGLDSIPPIPETAGTVVSQKTTKDSTEEIKEEMEDWTQVTKKGKKPKQEPPPPQAPVVKQKKLVQMVSNKADKERKSNNFERLIAKLQEVPKFASYTREGIIEVITTVRTERGGLSGLTTMDIINAAILVANRPSFERRFKPQMSDVVQRKPLLPIPSMPANIRKPLLPLPPYPPNTAMVCFNQTEDEDICVICHDGLSTETTKVLECGHVFHNGCIKEWVLGREMTCPTCRRHVLFPEDFPKLGK